MEETGTDLILLIYKGSDVLFKFIHRTDILKKKVKMWVILSTFELFSGTSFLHPLSTQLLWFKMLSAVLLLCPP